MWLFKGKPKQTLHTTRLELDDLQQPDTRVEIVYRCDISSTMLRSLKDYAETTGVSLYDDMSNVVNEALNDYFVEMNADMSREEVNDV